MYIYLLIEFACGKVPLWALKDGGVRRPWCLVLSQGALLKVFQKILSEICEPKASQRERKGTVESSNGEKRRTNTQHDPNGTKRGSKGWQPTQKLLQKHALERSTF